jgi:O-methyltransferase involved in polyketide biosynthesis
MEVLANAESAHRLMPGSGQQLDETGTPTHHPVAISAEGLA